MQRNNSNNYYEDYSDYDEGYTSQELDELTWDAMTDGMYGDMPEGFNGDYEWLGF